MTNRYEIVHYDIKARRHLDHRTSIIEDAWLEAERRDVELADWWAMSSNEAERIAL